MKLSSILVALLFSFCISCQAQSSKPGVKLVNGPDYTANATVTYQVTGTTGYYYIGMEKLLDGQWREVILDVAAGAPERGAVVRKFMPGKPVTGNYQLKKLPSIYRQNGHEYRLKINYGTAPDAVTQTGFSREFHVK